MKDLKAFLQGLEKQDRFLQGLEKQDRDTEKILRPDVAFLSHELVRRSPICKMLERDKDLAHLMDKYDLGEIMLRRFTQNEETTLFEAPPMR